MKQVEIAIQVAGQEQAEILAAMLSDFPFDGFQIEQRLLKGYISKDRYSKECAAIGSVIDGMGAEWSVNDVPEINWNQQWESNFSPVDIAGRCTVRAPFHPEPESGLDIVIMPKMSFGTGHHATTHLMVDQIMQLPLGGRQGLDMGCGTGVLAIAAVKCGAAFVDAVDIDEWSCENSLENIRTNAVDDRVEVIRGELDSVLDKTYNFILANINRNILTRDMHGYASILRPGGMLVMSGILDEDIPLIQASAANAGFGEFSSRTKDGWALIYCRKI